MQAPEHADQVRGGAAFGVAKPVRSMTLRDAPRSSPDVTHLAHWHSPGGHKCLLSGAATLAQLLLFGPA
jgi:hypothetical protein